MDTIRVDGKLKYRIEEKSCRILKVSSTWTPTKVYSQDYTFREWVSIDTFEVTAFPDWVYWDDFTHLWEAYPHEPIMGTYSAAHRQAFVSTVTYSKEASCYAGLKRSIRFTKCLSYPLEEGMMDCEYGKIDWEAKVEWMTGIGLLKETGEGDFAETKTKRRLIASYVQGVSCGEFSDISKDNCQVGRVIRFDPPGFVTKITFGFINPTPRDIIVYFPSRHPVTSLTLMDMSGRRVTHREVNTQFSVTIPHELLAPGIYILAARDAEGDMVEWRKVIVRPK